MTNIKINIQSDKKDVKGFLKELKDILNSEKFNTDEDMIIVKSKRKKWNIQQNILWWIWIMTNQI